MEVAKENNTLAQHIAVEKTKVLEGEDIKRYTISVKLWKMIGKENKESVNFSNTFKCLLARIVALYKDINICGLKDGTVDITSALGIPTEEDYFRKYVENPYVSGQ